MLVSLIDNTYLTLNAEFVNGSIGYVFANTDCVLFTHTLKDGPVRDGQTFSSAVNVFKLLTNGKMSLESVYGDDPYNALVHQLVPTLFSNYTVFKVGDVVLALSTLGTPDKASAAAYRVFKNQNSAIDVDEKPLKVTKVFPNHTYEVEYANGYRFTILGELICHKMEVVPFLV